MAYTKYSLTPANNTAAPPDGAPEGMLPSAVNDTMRDMMAQIRDCGDGIRGGTYTMTAPVITGGSISGTTFSSSAATITGGTINGTTIGATTASTGKFSTLTNAALTSGRVTYAGTGGLLQDDADFTFNGTTVTMANDASISGLTVGKGGGAVGSNSAFGPGALSANTTGAAIVAVGYQAFATNTTGANSTAVGYQALVSNTTASSNTAVGYQAGYSNTTGAGHVYMGYQAGYSSTTATSPNVAIGYQAFYTNSTGEANIAIGRDALRSNTTASFNTAVGYQAGTAVTTGQYNTFYGVQAGQSLTTGNGNTFIGYSPSTGGAGSSITTGSKNVILGGYTGNNGGLDIRTASNYIVLSDGDGSPLLACTDKNNAEWRLNAPTGASFSGVLDFCTNNTINSQIYHQNSNDRLIVQNDTNGVYLASGGIVWVSNSDERKKDIIEPITNAVEKVFALRSVIGKYKTEAEGTRRPFLIAQDVQAVFPEAVDAQNPDDLGVGYSDLVPLLVAAIKELNAKVTALEAQLGAK